MSYKHNCTKGPYQLHKVGGENSVNDHNSAFTGNGGHTPIAHVEMHDFNDDDTTTDEQKANAELIAEAFSVLAETGMTPRELAERLHEYRELLAATRLTLYAAEHQLPGNVQHFYTNRLKIRTDLQRDAKTGKFNPIAP